MSNILSVKMASSNRWSTAEIFCRARNFFCKRQRVRDEKFSISVASTVTKIFHGEHASVTKNFSRRKNFFRRRTSLLKIKNPSPSFTGKISYDKIRAMKYQFSKQTHEQNSRQSSHVIPRQKLCRLLFQRRHDFPWHFQNQLFPAVRTSVQAAMTI